MIAGVEHLGLFVLAGWLLNLTPGPDVLFIVTHALRRGARAGVAAVLGITSGVFVHIFAAAVGVGALLAASSMAFNLLKWIGALYSLVMGSRLLLQQSKNTIDKEATSALSIRARGLKSIYFQGFWTNVLNPKVALFFLAFVPQFIAPDAPNKPLAFVLLGVLFNLNSIPINVGYVLLAAWASQRVALVQRAMQALERMAGAMFVGFGIRLALTDNPAR